MTFANQTAYSPSDTHPILEVRDLTMSYGDKEVLKGVTFDVAPSEVITFIGESGAGKSTMLRCLNLLEEPLGGDIRFRGKSILEPGFDRKAYRARVGMVFQSFYLFDNMSVLDNCILAQTKVLKRSDKEAREKSMALLEEVGMADYAKSFPGQLSGGQAQRVAIARALSMDPDILLFDEPTSALDPKNVGEVLRVMQKIAEEGMTMLVVTHEMAFAREVAKRVCFMAQGKILESAPSHEFFERPKTQEAQDFIRTIHF